MKRVAVVASLALAGCFDDGGPDAPFVQVDGPTAITLTDLGAYALNYELPSAGTYEFLFEGKADCSDPATFNVYFSFSGQGEKLSGDSSEQYELASCGKPANMKLRAAIRANGSGPWLMQILLLPTAMPSPLLTFTDLSLSVR